ncbi:P-loop containing nucleoside triphosphate hydrolase protein [Umbelopsis sp. PMI_123]|nr:P-loop containing nucleoside triphosphate hydrolase protein [Umbelopsis sp. PMI_123]
MPRKKLRKLHDRTNILPESSKRRSRMNKIDYSESNTRNERKRPCHSDSESEFSKSSDSEAETPRTPVKSFRSSIFNTPTRRSLNLIGASPKRTPKKPVLAYRAVQRVNQSYEVVPLPQRSREATSATTAYERARERLHVSAVPDSLPCRELEFEEIMAHVETAIEEGTGTCIYISGVPGTGKTATVLEVIRHLQHKSDNENLGKFQFVEINGMKVTEPSQAYSILWESVKPEEPNSKKRRVTANHALDLLEHRYNTYDEDRQTTVVLMDELDLLVTKKQTVMYNFFEWPNRANSKLIVIAVANTMDLPERMLSNKVSSRLGLTRLNFQPYTHHQLYQIVESRLEGIEEFEKEAVEFAARKVSAVSGDARRALDICRRAIEIVEERVKKGNAKAPKSRNVTIPVINEAVREMFSSPTVTFVQQCSLHQKLFLVSVLKCIQRNGLADVEFGEVAQQHVQTCRWHHIEAPGTSDLMRVCESLGQTRALVVEGGRLDLGMRIALNISESDLIMACKGDKFIGKLVSNA